MTHLKHAGPIRRAAAGKRTALVEIYSDEAAMNEPLFSEAELIAADLAAVNTAKGAA